MRTSLPVSLSPIGQIFLQRSLDPVFPTVDRLTIQFKARNQFQYLRNRHSVPENPRYQLGIIPIFRIEFIGQSLDSSLVTTLIGELEVVPLRTIFIHSFHNFSLDYILRTKNTVIVIGQTGKDLVRFTVFQTDKGNPFFFIILETNHVCLQLDRTDQCLGRLINSRNGFLLLLLG